MGKKIIILNGSPRAKGNTTALTAEFKRGAEAAGNEVQEFFLSKMKINGCLGCWCGGKDPEHPCSQRDDMEKIYPAYREADVVVLASPLYYWFISGFLKNAFDRLFAIAECDPNYRNPKKQSVLIMAAEGAGFEESEHWYDHLEKHIGWKSLGNNVRRYLTLIGYYNSIRELGGAVRLLQGDIPKRIKYLRKRLNMDKIRYLNRSTNVEITSRMSSYQIPEQLKKLETPYTERNCLDIGSSKR